MPIRFWRRIRLAPGVTLNISKKGVSLTIGRRGMSWTIGRRGHTANVGLPGSGLSYREHIGHDKAKRLVAKAKDKQTNQSRGEVPRGPGDVDAGRQ